MGFVSCLEDSPSVLMEGALGERLKREHRLHFDEHVAMASLVYSERGRAALCALWGEYADIAARYGLPFVATTPTRRANRERVAASSHGSSIIQDNMAVLREVQQRHASAPMYVGGLMGCRGDAYSGAPGPSAAEAQAFHSWQAELFALAGADFLFAGIMPTLPEAVGMARAMAGSGLPYVISFMVRADGALLDGTTVHEAIAAIDASSETPPVCYMANCVHPTVLHGALSQAFNRTSLVRSRFWGIQANAARLSPEELDGATDLATSDPDVLADEMMRLREDCGLRVFGGCCGTDGSHLEAIASRLGRCT